MSAFYHNLCFSLQKIGDIPLITALKLFKPQNFLAFLFTCLCGSIYFHNLDKPQAPFWDENYYIATTERYLNEIAQLEPHPPLGLMVIAAGEYLFRPNKALETRHLATKSHVTGDQLPSAYSFYGIRFFPALFGALSILVFLALLANVSNSLWIAGSVSLALLFENSFLTHFRAAHLDSIQLFFILSSLFIFSKLYKRDTETSSAAYLLLAIVCIAAVLVKVNSVIVLIVFPTLLWRDRKLLGQNSLAKTVDIYVIKIAVISAGMLTTIFLVFLAHTLLGSQVPDKTTGAGEKTWKNASNVYKEYIDNRNPVSPKLVAYVVRDYYNFMSKDHRGVPKFDPCKAGENGSHPSSWLFGKKTINYRWDSANGFTRYVQLVSNQVNWGIGLLGVIISLSIVISVRILNADIADKLTYKFIEFYSGLYVVFMGIHLYLAEQRVMYLYHYFSGLALSLILAGLSFRYIIIVKDIKQSIKRVILSLLVLVSFLNFIWLAPLSFHLALTKEQCEARNFVQFVVECR